VGDWSDVIGELPKKLKDWMPRLASEGIIGADAIFACLGPALEIFSQYSSVEKPNGDVVTLKEYLEKVWGAISQVALDMVFMGGNAEGFEEDARLTAMWLWTLRSSDGAIDSEDGTGGSPQFALDYGTVHKITVGLGIEVENLKTVVEIKGDTARLYSVKERAEYLFSGADVASGRRTSSTKLEELNLFEDLLSEPDSKIDGYNITDEVMRLGDTILNRLHQAMLLFAQGKTGTLKKFLVEREVGKDENFWKLAQALNALYPAHSDERRWVEAVQAYKKNLGF